jgi:hypothetical protein
MYFYEQVGQQAGPLPGDQLVVQGVKAATLVWSEGMPDWVAAGTVLELHAFFVSDVHASVHLATPAGAHTAKPTRPRTLLSAPTRSVFTGKNLLIAGGVLFALDAEEKLRLPAGLRYPVSILKKQQPVLKPLNAAYLRLLESFRELVTGSAWEKRIYQLFDESELEQMPEMARQCSKAEILYLHYVSQHWTEPQRINDSYLESVRHTLSVQWLKHELLRHLADL